MKNSGSLWRLLGVLAVIGLLYYFNQHVINNKLDEWFATAPDDHLTTARKAADDNAIDACLKEIDIAIVEMQDIEVFSDSTSRNLIDKSIEDLKILESHIENHELNVDELNLVFAKGINSLAYTYLKISEDELRHDHEVEAVNSLKIVIDHLYNAMGFMKKRNIEEEMVLIRHIYSVIDSIQGQPNFNLHALDQLFDEIQHIIHEEEQKLEDQRTN
ncbi:MAG: hypothetical protein JXQ96_18210 [Cyclobacteriaceae bacterium]